MLYENKERQLPEKAHMQTDVLRDGVSDVIFRAQPSANTAPKLRDKQNTLHQQTEVQTRKDERYKYTNYDHATVDHVDHEYVECSSEMGSDECFDSGMCVEEYRFPDIQESLL